MKSYGYSLAGWALALLVSALGVVQAQSEPASAPPRASAQLAAAEQPPAQPAAAAPVAEAAPAPPRRKPFESMMFTVDEYNEIQGRVASGSLTDTNQGKQAIEDATLYLSTIVYYGPRDWTIWVNGVPISPTQEFHAFQVTEIDANSVQLLVPLSAQGMRPVRLSPNQTFITKTGMVVEGRAQ